MWTKGTDYQTPLFKLKTKMHAEGFRGIWDEYEQASRILLGKFDVLAKRIFDKQTKHAYWDVWKDYGDNDRSDEAELETEDDVMEYLRMAAEEAANMYESYDDISTKMLREGYYVKKIDTIKPEIEHLISDYNLYSDVKDVEFFKGSLKSGDPRDKSNWNFPKLTVVMKNGDTKEIEWNENNCKIVRGNLIPDLEPIKKISNWFNSIRYEKKKLENIEAKQSVLDLAKELGLEIKSMTPCNGELWLEDSTDPYLMIELSDGTKTSINCPRQFSRFGHTNFVWSEFANVTKNWLNKIAKERENINPES